jgi:hypothetical protein
MGRPSANIRKEDIAVLSAKERRYVIIIVLKSNAEHVTVGDAGKTE